MAETPSFNSWEPTWNHYAHVVSQVAFKLDPLTTEAERSASITASVAAGFLDESSVDPLAAMLVGLLANRSAADRLVAAHSLIEGGIDVDRALSATGSERTRNPTPTASRQAGSVTPPTFAVICAQARLLWEERGASANQRVHPEAGLGAAGVDEFATMRAIDRKLKLAADREAEAAREAERQELEQHSLQLAANRTRRRKQTAAGLLAVVVAGTFGGWALGPRLLNRGHQRKSAPLLTVRDLPKQWALTFATAHQPAPVLNPTSVFQRFDSLDKKQTVLVTTLREDSRFADASLGTPLMDRSLLDSSAMKIQAEATATDSFPVHTPANAPVMMEWKQPLVPFVINQAETIVYVEAHGMPSSDVRIFGRSLTARPKLLEKGWATPKGFSEQIAIPKREMYEGIQSSLMFQSTLDGKTRVVVQMHRTGEQTLDIGDLYPRETVRLPSGRVVTFRREFRHNYSWRESGYEFSVTVLRSDMETLGAAGSTQQIRLDFSRLEPLPNRHLDGILDLLDRIRIGNDEQWRSLTAGFQASMHDFQSLSDGTIGGHVIQTRGLRTVIKEKGQVLHTTTTLCAYSVCAPIYQSSGYPAKEADLLIDDHWWHFRQIAKTDKTNPRYFTSPAVDSFKTGEVDFDQTYKWWGIDFGPKTTAARHADEQTLLLRPLPH
jgi:hypothetical protein